MKFTEEEKARRKEFKEIGKRLDKEAGRDKVRYHSEHRSFVIFGGTEVTEGGWMIGRKWMTAKYMSGLVHKWVKQSYATRADNHLDNQQIPEEIRSKLKIIDSKYDLSAGCGQCGGCSWYTAIDGDYGFCFNEQSPNEGRITFEHGGCIEHSFIQQLLNEPEST